MRTLTVTATPVVPSLRLLHRWSARFVFDPPSAPLRLSGHTKLDGSAHPAVTATLSIEGHDFADRLVLDAATEEVLAHAGAWLAITELSILSDRVALRSHAFAFCAGLTTVELPPHADVAPTSFAHCPALRAIKVRPPALAIPRAPTRTRPRSPSPPPGPHPTQAAAVCCAPTAS
jgi:hypothetical protein